MIYLDSSAIVKLVVREPESEALYDYLAKRPERISSDLARVEVRRALRRAGVSAAFLRRAEQVLNRIAMVPLDETVLQAAADVEPAEVRSLDALHLATAMSLPPLEAFVAYDERLLAGARQLGCELASPS